MVSADDAHLFDRSLEMLCRKLYDPRIGEITLGRDSYPRLEAVIAHHSKSLLFLVWEDFYFYIHLVKPTEAETLAGSVSGHLFCVCKHLKACTLLLVRLEFLCKLGCGKTWTRSKRFREQEYDYQ